MRHGSSTILAYASHLGYRSPELPLFLHSVGSADPLAQIDHAAAIGMAGVQYALAASRPVSEQAAVGARLREFKLTPGCVLFAPFEAIRAMAPGDPNPAAGSAFFDEVRRALEVAQRVGSRLVVILAARSEQLNLEVQRRVFAERLARAASLAADAGIVLGLEPLSSTVLPPMLMTRLDDALAIMAHCGAENVRLLFDTAHVEANDGDVVAQFRRVFASVAALQIADVPNRWEPGSGRIDFEAILQYAYVRGFGGLVELEHGWSREEASCEAQGVQRLIRLDAAAQLTAGVGVQGDERP